MIKWLHSTVEKCSKYATKYAWQILAISNKTDRESANAVNDNTKTCIDKNQIHEGLMVSLHWSVFANICSSLIKTVKIQ